MTRQSQVLRAQTAGVGPRWSYPLIPSAFQGIGYYQLRALVFTLLRTEYGVHDGLSLPLPTSRTEPHLHSIHIQQYSVFRTEYNGIRLMSPPPSPSSIFVSARKSRFEKENTECWYSIQTRLAERLTPQWAH